MFEGITHDTHHMPVDNVIQISGRLATFGESFLWLQGLDIT